MAEPKSPGIAALLSIVWAGIGHFYIGAWLRGIVFFLADGYFAFLFYSSLSTNYVGPTPVIHVDWNPLLLSLVVGTVAVVDSALGARAHNRKHFVKCPRCRANNAIGSAVCLVCWTPLPGTPAPVQGPRPLAPPPP